MPIETVCLVDGVGRPKLLEMDDPPSMVEYAHEGIKSGPSRKVKFDRQEDERDPNGRAVYRMRAVFRPEIRIWYLRLQTIPFNPPRVP
jgi:hypothetical protein